MIDTFLVWFLPYVILSVLLCLLAIVFCMTLGKRFKSNTCLLLLTVLALTAVLPKGFSSYALFHAGEYVRQRENVSESDQGINNNVQHSSEDMDQEPTDAPLLSTPPAVNNEPTVLPNEGKNEASLPSVREPSPTVEKTGNTLNRVLFFVWLGGAVLLFIAVFIPDLISRRRLKKSFMPIASPSLLSIYHGVCDSVDLNRIPRVAVSPLVLSPCLVGIVRPTVLLPYRMTFTERESLLLLRHELEHYKRGDLFLKFITLIALAFQWWNPLFYLLVGRISFYIEASCDERVVVGSSAEDTLVYGELMLKLAKRMNNRHMGPKRVISASFTHQKGKATLHRIRRLLDEKKRFQGKPLVLTVCLLCILSFFLYSCVPSVKDTLPDDTAASTEDSDQESPLDTEGMNETYIKVYPSNGVDGDTLKAPEKEGHTFLYWQTGDMTDGKVTLEAVYSVNTYSVSFVANGGTLSDVSQTLAYGSDLPIPTRGNDRFAGWYRDALLTVSADSVPAADSTLYAAWENETATSAFSYTNDGRGITLTGFGGSGSVVIPSYIEGLPVVSIGRYAFEGSSITSVVCPDTLQTIGVGAFYNCRLLTEAYLNQAITFIDPVAFDACYSLRAITYAGSKESWAAVGGKDSSISVEFISA